MISRRSDKKANRYQMAAFLRDFVGKTSESKRVSVWGCEPLIDSLSCALAWMDDDNPNYKTLMRMVYGVEDKRYYMGTIGKVLLGAADVLEKSGTGGCVW